MAKEKGDVRGTIVKIELSEMQQRQRQSWRDKRCEIEKPSRKTIQGKFQMPRGYPEFSSHITVSDSLLWLN